MRQQVSQKRGHLVSDRYLGCGAKGRIIGPTGSAGGLGIKMRNGSRSMIVKQLISPCEPGSAELSFKRRVCPLSECCCALFPGFDANGMFSEPSKVP